VRPFILASLLTGLTAVYSGCVREVSPRNLPQASQKLVVHCYLSPQDTLITAVVNVSRTVLGTKTPGTTQGSLASATVQLAEGGRTLALRYDARLGLHRGDPHLFPIVAGRTYTLTATLPGGESVTAQTTVPEAVSIVEAYIDSLPNRYNQGQQDYFVRLSWRDLAGRANFYRVGGDTEFGTRQPVFRPNQPPRDTLVRMTSQLTYPNDSPFLTDTDRDGRLLLAPRGRMTFAFVNGQLQARPPVIINAYLLHTDEAYYRYHDALRRQDQTDGNPFAEPVLLPSNIQGGLGCFGSFNRAAVRLILR